MIAMPRSNAAENSKFLLSCILLLTASLSADGQGAPGVVSAPGVTSTTSPPAPAIPSGSSTTSPPATTTTPAAPQDTSGSSTAPPANPPADPAAAQSAAQHAVATGKNAVVADVNAISASGSSTELDSALTAANAIGQAFSDTVSTVNLGIQSIAEKLTAGANLLLDSLISLLQNGDRVQASQTAIQGQTSINDAAALANVVTQAPIVFASATATATITVTTACGTCAAYATSQAFAISFGVPVKADAYATASCNVVCVTRSREALDKGAYAAASAGAATAASLSGIQASGQTAAQAKTKIRKVRQVTRVQAEVAAQASQSASPPNLTDAEKATLGVVVASANSTARASLYGVAALTGRGAAELQKLKDDVAAAVAATRATAVAAGLRGADPLAIASAQQAAATAAGAAEAISQGNPAAALADVAAFATDLAQTVGQVAPPVPGLESLRAAVAPSTAPAISPGESVMVPLFTDLGPAVFPPALAASAPLTTGLATGPSGGSPRLSTGIPPSGEGSALPPRLQPTASPPRFAGPPPGIVASVPPPQPAANPPPTVPPPQTARSASPSPLPATQPTNAPGRSTGSPPPPFPSPPPPFPPPQSSPPPSPRAPTPQQGPPPPPGHSGRRLSRLFR